jgi:hypothetical protein
MQILKYIRGNIKVKFYYTFFSNPNNVIPLGFDAVWILQE